MARMRLAREGSDAGGSVLAKAQIALTDMSDLDVSLILIRYGGEVLLARREGAGSGGDTWQLPGGTPAAGEHPLAAVLRRTRETVGLRLSEPDVRLATVVYWHDPSGVSRIGLFFAAEHDASLMGDPTVAEPTQCAKLKWSPRGLLPTGTDPVCAAAVGLARRGVTSAVLGQTGITCETWANPQPPVRRHLI